MIKITKPVIDTSAKNLLFKLTEKELNDTMVEFDAILSQMSFIGHIENIDIVEPMTFPIEEIQSAMREDIPATPLDVEEELKMAPSRLGNQVRLPKVVG
jgi:aspartyl/glutamyl-tRNA(Asn/Gln) amidotransferase C subunit